MSLRCLSESLGWCLMGQVYLNGPKVPNRPKVPNEPKVPNGPKVPKWAYGA